MRLAKSRNQAHSPLTVSKVKKRAKPPRVMTVDQTRTFRAD